MVASTICPVCLRQGKDRLLNMSHSVKKDPFLYRLINVSQCETSFTSDIFFYILGNAEVDSSDT